MTTNNIKVPDFIHAKEAIAAQWARMEGRPLFRVAASGDSVWALYLAAFPAGTNRMFRKKLEHDCSCCRSFIKNLGNVVALTADGEAMTIWDGGCEKEPAYAAVFSALSGFVRGHAIFEPFLHREATIGTDENFEAEVGGTAKAWAHFYARIPKALQRKGIDIPTEIGERRAAFDVLRRGLREFKLDAFDTVLDLIGQNALYRGAEHRGAVEMFRRFKVGFDALHGAAVTASRTGGNAVGLLDKRDAFVWFTAATESRAVCMIRNTAIGTLLTDLSEGVDIEAAVRKFEAMVAPTNYKRPTALVTPAMVEKARAAVAELGLTDALVRRHAVVEDLKLENVLFVDRDTRAAINGDAFDLVPATKSSGSKNVAKLEDVPVERFVSEILPRAESVEVLMENRHACRLVSLIGPAFPVTTNLFKWPNPFSWSYAGEVADSIKERVKKAGGSVTGDVCCRLSWSNHDDLDLHMVEPTGNRIYFGHKISEVTGGRLDVDMNAGLIRSTAPRFRLTREPVENIAYPSKARMRPGVYRLSVNQFSKRESSEVGFEVEVDVLGESYSFSYAKALRTGETVEVATIEVLADGIKVVPVLPAGNRSRKVWGLSTGDFHRVKAAMLSPNFWASEVGNGHLFLMLEGCAADVPVRGFYNEFLRSDLDPHRKVLELVGSKAAVVPSDRQLSGIGFSSTQKSSFVCRIKGGFNRTINVVLN